MIYRHLDKNSNSQHGFRKNHYCETQLITTITEIPSILQVVQTDGLD